MCPLLNFLIIRAGSRGVGIVEQLFFVPKNRGCFCITEGGMDKNQIKRDILIAFLN